MACFHGKIVILPHHARSCASMNVSIYIRSDLQRRIIIKKKGGGVISFKKIKNRVNFSSSVSITDVTKYRLHRLLPWKLNNTTIFRQAFTVSGKIDIFDEKVNNFMTMTTMTVSLDFFGKREAETRNKKRSLKSLASKEEKQFFFFLNTSERKLPFSFFSLAKKKKMFPRIN